MGRWWNEVYEDKYKKLGGKILQQQYHCVRHESNMKPPGIELETSH
jgi:hypothetical protein